MVSTIFNTIESGFIQALARADAQSLSSHTLGQTATIHLEATNPHIAQHIHKTHTVFSSVDFALFCLGIKQVADAIQQKHGITILGSLDFHSRVFMTPNNLKVTCTFLGLSGVLFFAAYKISSMLNQYFEPYKDRQAFLSEAAIPDQEIRKITVDFGRPTSQKLAQQLLIVRIIINGALTVLSPSRMLPLLNLLAQSYSLIKLSHFKWLNFIRVFDWDQTAAISKVIISYRALLTPFSNPKAADKCAICMDDEQKPDSYFCTYHPFHDKCVTQMIASKSDTFENGNSYVLTTETSNTGSTSYSYDVTLAQANLPSCPFNCLEQYPEHAYFDIRVHNRFHGKFKAGVSYKNEIFEPQPALPRFFEAVNLIYNVFQAGLSYTLQRHPELTGRILLIQRVLLLADAAALARDYFQLYGHFKDRLKKKTDKPFSTVQERLLFTVAACVPLILSAIGVYWINRSLKPTTDLKEILKTAVALSPKDLQSANVYWSTPGFHKMGQFLSLSRICVNLFSAFAASSRESLFHLTTASLQALSLYKNSQLPWFKFEKTFIKPDASFWSSYGDQSAINKLTVGSHFLPTSENLPSTLQSIYDYCTNFFNNSSRWDRYWDIHRKNGSETSRRLVYSVIIKPDPMKGDKLPYIDRMTAFAMDRWEGFAPVIFKTMN